MMKPIRLLVLLGDSDFVQEGVELSLGTSSNRCLSLEVNELVIKASDQVAPLLAGLLEGLALDHALSIPLALVFARTTECQLDVLMNTLNTLAKAFAWLSNDGEGLSNVLSFEALLKRVDHTCRVALCEVEQREIKPSLTTTNMGTLELSLSCSRGILGEEVLNEGTINCVTKRLDLLALALLNCSCEHSLDLLHLVSWETIQELLVVVEVRRNRLVNLLHGKFTLGESQKRLNLFVQGLVTIRVVPLAFENVNELGSILGQVGQEAHKVLRVEQIQVAECICRCFRWDPSLVLDELHLPVAR